MNLPHRFRKDLKKRQDQRGKEEKKQLKEEKTYRQRRSAYVRKEKLLEPEKVKVCARLFGWRKEFLETVEGKKMFKSSGAEIWVFEGGWAHELPEFGGGGCWSRVYITKTGFRYWPGYKWMPRPDSDLENPKAMAKLLSHAYLKRFLESITSGRVYRDILGLNEDQV